MSKLSVQLHHRHNRKLIVSSTLEQHLSSSPQSPHPLLFLRPPHTLQTQLPGVTRDAIRAPLGPFRLVPASLRLRHCTDAAPAAVCGTVDLAAADDVAAAAGAEDVVGAAHRRWAFLLDIELWSIDQNCRVCLFLESTLFVLCVISHRGWS
jgi:hypothetical protein